MVSSCFVPKCKSNTKGGPKAPIFRVPLKEEDRTKKWLEAIARPGYVPNIHSRVCGVHFREEDVVWTTDFHDVKTNRTYSAPLQVPRLKPTAVPSIFPDRRKKPVPKRLAKSGQSNHDVTSALTKWREIKSGNQQPTQSVTIPPPDLTKPHLPGCPLHQLEYIFNDLEELAVCNTKFAPPEPWHVITNPTSVMYVHVAESPAPTLVHSVTINADLKVSLYMGNMVILTMGALKFPVKMNNIANIHAMLSQFLTYKSMIA